MEMFGMVIGLLIATWFLGFHRTARTAADAANAQVRALAMKSQRNLREEALKIGEISDEDLAKIRKGLAAYEEFKL